MNTISKQLTLSLTLWLATLLLSACVSVPSSPQRQASANQLAARHQWQATQITTEQFDLVSYQVIHHTKERLLTIYLEGDGLAWLTKSKVSTDPTPINPIALKLALSHPQGNAVYLARPCQYVGGVAAKNCTKHSWADSRFSEEVITSTNEAINRLKAEFGAEKLQLVGYSGGGAVAVLVAARRDDVTKLITVAGNLDHQAWTTHHTISPLTDSRNPADFRQQLSIVEQIHFVGANDEIIPPFIVRDFVAGLPSSANAKVIVVPNQSHGCCWQIIWADLMLEQSN